MSYLASWIQQLVLAVIVATFLDLLLPNNTMQRYVRLVMGLMILMLILSPLLTFLKSDWNMNDLFSDGRSTTNNELASLPHIQKQSEDLMEAQEKWVEDTVQSRMERAISDGIEQQFSLSVSEVSVSLSEKGEQVSVDGVVVTIDPNSSVDGNGEIETVKPVNIDLSDNRNEEETEQTSATATSSRIEEIQKWVSREWNIDVANIQIDIAEREG